jgi:hypothetical protein
VASVFVERHGCFLSIQVKSPGCGIGSGVNGGSVEWMAKGRILWEDFYNLGTFVAICGRSQGGLQVWSSECPAHPFKRDMTAVGLGSNSSEVSVPNPDICVWEQAQNRWTLQEAVIPGERWRPWQ